MSIPQIVEVAIGLIFVYYILGSIVSLITQWINESLETRAVALKRYLIKIVGDKKVEDLVNLPQVKALQPIRYKNVLSFIKSATEPKMIEKIPVTTLVDAYFDLAGFTANKDLNAAQLTDLINKLPDSEGKQAFIGWINQGVTNINDLRSRTTSYFSGLMDQAAATFRANARSIVIILSILVTVLFGTDSIQIAQALWANADLRAVATAKADMVIAQGGTSASLNDLIAQLGDLSIRIGWWNTDKPAAGSDLATWALFIVLKILGLGITAVAVSQGSSFWYDLLKKIVTPTNSAGGGSSSSSSDGSAEAKG